MSVAAPLQASTTTVVLAEQWRRYRATGDRATRDRLILAYSPLVKYVAGGIASGMPAHVDLADLVSFGLGGLIDAVEHYEPARGVRFEAYAGQRVRGAIFDELRKQDWVPRAVRAEGKAITRASAELSTRLQRVPTEAELADELSLTADELAAALLRVADTHVVALDRPSGFDASGDDRGSVLDLLVDVAAVDPVASAVAEDLRARIAGAVRRLPARDQLILGLRYQQGLTLAEIGEVLGLTESRICQLHTKALIQLTALIPDVLT